MLRKRSLWLDEAALVEKAGGKPRCEPHGAILRSKARKKNEQRRDKGFLIEAAKLMKVGSGLSGIQTNENQNLNASVERSRDPEELSCSIKPPLFPNPLFPILSGLVAALHFDEARTPESSLYSTSSFLLSPSITTSFFWGDNSVSDQTPFRCFARDK